MATTFSTNEQCRTLMPGLKVSGTGDTELNLLRASAYSDIISALTQGGYATGTFTAAPTDFSYLTLLEARLVAVDLLGGNPGTKNAHGGGKTFELWMGYINNHMDRLRKGKTSILQDSTGTFVAAPSAGLAGIVSDERNPGMNISDPQDWQAGDPLERWPVTAEGREDEL